MNPTNQQLAFARVQLSAAQQAHSRFSKRAHWQAAVWQLNAAVECYAAELQEQTKAKVQLRPGPGIFTRLAQDFDVGGVQSAELNELSRLEGKYGSWLHQLQSWATSLLTLAAGPGSVLTAETTLTELERSASGQIGVIAIAENDGELFSEERLGEALDEFSQLLNRHRENFAEY